MVEGIPNVTFSAVLTDIKQSSVKIRWTSIELLLTGKQIPAKMLDETNNCHANYHFNCFLRGVFTCL